MTDKGWLGLFQLLHAFIFFNTSLKLLVYIILLTELFQTTILDTYFMLAN